MRLNKYVALGTGMSRRDADNAIAEGRIVVDGVRATLGQQVDISNPNIMYDGEPLTPLPSVVTIMLHKPIGYVCSRDGQGSKTIYDIIPNTYHNLKPVGRLDKDSSGLLLLTNDGTLAYELTHPSFRKEKTYEVALNRNLTTADYESLTSGILLEDGMSKLGLSNDATSKANWIVKIHEGRNRQIRRTFDSLGYKVIKLHRTQFGKYSLDNLASGKIMEISD